MLHKISNPESETLGNVELFLWRVVYNILFLGRTSANKQQQQQNDLLLMIKSNNCLNCQVLLKAENN